MLGTATVARMFLIGRSRFRFAIIFQPIYIIVCLYRYFSITCAIIILLAVLLLLFTNMLLHILFAARTMFSPTYL